jgi:hypothetical protein
MSVLCGMHMSVTRVTYPCFQSLTDHLTGLTRLMGRIVNGIAFVINKVIGVPMSGWVLDVCGLYLYY